MRTPIIVFLVLLASAASAQCPPFCGDYGGPRWPRYPDANMPLPPVRYPDANMPIPRYTPPSEHGCVRGWSSRNCYDPERGRSYTIPRWNYP